MQRGEGGVEVEEGGCREGVGKEAGLHEEGVELQAEPREAEVGGGAEGAGDDGNGGGREAIGGEEGGEGGEGGIGRGGSGQAEVAGCGWRSALARKGGGTVNRESRHGSGVPDNGYGVT